MVGNFHYEYLRPNPNVVTGERSVKAELAILRTLRFLRDASITIVGFFDVTTGVRTYGTFDTQIWDIRRGALEMSFAPAIRPGLADRTGLGRKWRTPDSDFWKQVVPFWNEVREVLHFPIGDDPNLNKDCHDALVKTGSADYCGAYVHAFLDHYEEEEHNFVYYHDIGHFPRWSRFEGELVPKYDKEQPWWKLTGLMTENDKRRLYASGSQPLEMVRQFIRETILVTCYADSQAAVAVPDDSAADFLRRAVGFRGVIVNLQALDYPGMDHMQAVHLSHFRECGFDRHLPDCDSRRAWRWPPTFIRRADDSYGYLKCTFRHVQVMRHWTELWYPCCVAQQG